MPQKKIIYKKSTIKWFGGQDKIKIYSIILVN
jgi:hypothetical protein